MSFCRGRVIASASAPCDDVTAALPGVAARGVRGETPPVRVKISILRWNFRVEECWTCLLVECSSAARNCFAELPHLPPE